MASVLVDTNTYKITLRIINNFMGLTDRDFLNFLKKGYDPESEKLITWEMSIFFKMLYNENIQYVNRCLQEIKKSLEENLNKNLYLHIDKEQKEDLYIKTYSNNENNGYFFITPEVRICENPASIKIYFYCEESLIIENSAEIVESEILKHYEDLRKVTYLSQLHNLISIVFYTMEGSDYFLFQVKFENPKASIIQEIIKSSKFNNHENYILSLFGSLFLIVVDYYKKIMDDLTEVTGKELVEEAFSQVINKRQDKGKLLRIFNTREDFRKIHMNKYYKLETVKQILKIVSEQ